MSCRVEKLEVPPHKRAKFVGLGGYNLRKMTAETGVQLTPIDESSFSIFAPNKAAMDEAKEIIAELMADEVCALSNYMTCASVDLCLLTYQPPNLELHFFLLACVSL